MEKQIFPFREEGFMDIWKIGFAIGLIFVKEGLILMTQYFNIRCPHVGFSCWSTTVIISNSLHITIKRRLEV